MPDTEFAPPAGYTRPSHATSSEGARLIAAERLRQIEKGWTPEHDAEHDKGQLARAAACYARASVSLIGSREWLTETGPAWARARYEGDYLAGVLAGMAGDLADLVGFHYGRDDSGRVKPPTDWPDGWHPSWWKPSTDPIRDLVKAGALIAAEIDRLQATRDA